MSIRFAFDSPRLSLTSDTSPGYHDSTYSDTAHTDREVPSLMRTIRLIHIILALLMVIACANAAPTIAIRNNHDFAYDGPMSFRTALPDGAYKSADGIAIVKNGVARAVVHAEGHSSVTLKPAKSAAFMGRLAAKPIPGGLALQSNGKEVGRIELGLAVIPGKAATYTQAVDGFKPLNLAFVKQSDGTYTGKATSGDYLVEVTLTPYTGGWTDAQAKITSTSDKSDPTYLALIRKVSMPGISGVKTDWNGAILKGTEDPAITDRIATLSKGVDWCSWKSGGASWAAINQFSAGYTVQDSKGKWIPANHFYTWEKAAQKDGSIYLASEVAGANPSQDNGKYMGVRAYSPPLKGEPVILKWRLAMENTPKQDWEESQLYVTAGYRRVTESKDSAIVDLGVPYVEFGTSYFPYSTMTENFDYYRTTGLDREGWWPVSPKAWENWKAYQPQMETDLRIIKSMGFDLVRLHHLELIGTMDRQNCFAFLDFYMNTCRKLGMKVLFDTAGSPEWITSLVSRYKDVVKYVEIENEILIPGIPKGAPERWTAQYEAVKKASPATQAFLTGACNQGMFDRLHYLGVPFDRIGFHNYKHGAASMESIPSVMLGVANQATDYGKPAVLGEFNWKFLTALSPENRAKQMAQIYAGMLQPRAVPTVCQFHWQETMSVNPRLTRQGIRHYETINLDRTPKPEAIELMKLIKQYTRPDSPVRVLPVFICGCGSNGTPPDDIPFDITNHTGRTVTVKLSTESFQGMTCEFITPSTITLKPDQEYQGKLRPSIAGDALPGTYHYFIRAEYPGGVSYGWGIYRKTGAPKFDAPVLADLVEYPQGADIVDKLNYEWPISVIFGKDCPIIEMEMAYQLRNTLQAATGQDVYLCNSDDVPADTLNSGQLILVGTPDKNPLIKQANLQLPDGKGLVQLYNAPSGMQWLILTGATEDQQQAAATDVVLRFWNNAKDSVSRVSGLEKGAALGNKAAAGDVNLP